NELNLSRALEISKIDFEVHEKLIHFDCFGEFIVKFSTLKLPKIGIIKQTLLKLDLVNTGKWQVVMIIFRCDCYMRQITIRSILTIKSGSFGPLSLSLSLSLSFVKNVMSQSAEKQQT
ncbi:MAG: hypothetical protein KTM48_03600, partial [Wolbachia endosymbiont of Pissodes strobi]|nr:hypothetical protein [Wolbachia endosymbiont of Pissodes strobi]